MQYSPKLKKAMEEIKAIVKKYDIGAAVVLHAPGFSEYLNHIETSYSVAKFEPNGIRFKTKGRSHEDVRDTVNMINLFGTTMGNMSLVYFDLEDLLKKQMDINHGGLNHSGHTDQNN
jgi:hypothetical protein